MQGSSTEIVNIFLVSTAIILLLIVMVAFFIVIYQRRIMAQKLRMQEIEADAQRQKMAAIVDTQESERMRIARDLHDEVGAMLSTVKMSLKLSQRKLAKDGIENSLDESTDMLDTAIGSVRQISHDLLPPSLESLGLTVTIQQLTEKTAAMSGISFVCKVVGAQIRLPIRTELTLYRVMQELISNSLKHSQAKARTMEVQFEEKSLRMAFADDGMGFDLAGMKDSGAGLGLRGMESRVEALGGQLVMESSVGNGFRATISLTA